MIQEIKKTCIKRSKMCPCGKCNDCACFHKVLRFEEPSDTNIVFEITNNKNININDDFCFVFPCKTNPPSSPFLCYFNINGEKYKLEGTDKEILSSDLVRRKLYKAKVEEGNVIKLLNF